MCQPDDDYLDEMYEGDDDWDEEEEPLGSCDECDEDVYAADGGGRHGGELLCSQCLWIAMGEPGPDDEIDEDFFDEE